MPVLRLKIHVFLFTFIFSLIFQIENANAQISILSQYENAPLSLNPGLAGNSEGRVRFLSNMRNQMLPVYRVFGTSIDAKRVLGNSNHFGYGLNFKIDRAGSFVSASQINLFGSYRHFISKTESAYKSISFGAGVGFTIQRFGVEVENNPNLGAGVVWDMRNEFGTHVLFGFSFFQQTQVIGANLNSESTNIVVHGKFELPVFEIFAFTPSFLLTKYGQDNLVLAGISGKLLGGTLPGSNYLLVGIKGRFFYNKFTTQGLSGIILEGQLKRNKTLFALSFDFFRTSSARAVELSFGYLLGGIDE